MTSSLAAVSSWRRNVKRATCCSRSATLSLSSTISARANSSSYVASLSRRLASSAFPTAAAAVFLHLSLFFSASSTASCMIPISVLAMTAAFTMSCTAIASSKSVRLGTSIPSFFIPARRYNITRSSSTNSSSSSSSSSSEPSDPVFSLGSGPPIPSSLRFWFLFASRSASAFNFLSPNLLEAFPLPPRFGATRNLNWHFLQLTTPAGPGTTI
mmetsp:Transcript_111103/g.254753  ORF Transcript_111103/g.254753 Transcript_111103/m.254753 type:complete len:213 (+) Transcript_111103:1582-2220(+)